MRVLNRELYQSGFKAACIQNRRLYHHYHQFTSVNISDIFKNDNTFVQSSYMQKLVVIAGLICVLCSCNGLKSSPKEALSNFLTAMEKNDFAEAKKYATDDSQQFLDMIGKDGKVSNNAYNGKSFEVVNVETNGDEAKAEVKTSSSTPLYFHLKNERGAWKVKFNLSALMDMVKDVIKQGGVDIEKEVNKAIDSIKINIDSLP